MHRSWSTSCSAGPEGMALEPDATQLSLGLLETPAPASQLWPQLPAEQRAAAVAALARLIAKAANSTPEDAP